jgi:imidazolonepropionase-like amidohydrolase
MTHIGLMIVVALALLIVACSTAAAPLTTPIPSNTYAITDVAVVDVEQGRILPDQTVIIEDDLIRTVGLRTEVTVPAGARMIDGRDLYLMPGLVDAHVHYFDQEVFGRVMLANGVLLARDMGLPTKQAVKLRDSLKRGELIGPELIVTGSVLDGDPPIIPAISIGLKTPEEARAAIRKQAEAGVDMIKVYSKLDKEVFLAVVDEAQKAGLKVVGHVPDSIGIEEAAAAGLQSSEHLFGFEKIVAKLLGAYVRQTYAGMGAEAGYLQRLNEIDPAELQAVYQRLRTSGLTVCPTVIVFKTGTAYSAIKSGNFEGREYISPFMQGLWQSQGQQSDLPDFIWQNWAQMVKGLHDAGVPLMIGTDLTVPGILPGEAVHQEMEIWQDAGIPSAAVLRSATFIPARFMGLEDRLGTVAEGKTASLVLVKGNPLEDIRNTRLIDGVFLRGKYYDRADLDRLLSEAREAASSNPIDSAAPTATLEPAATPLPTSLPPLMIDDTWATYTNDQYGFSFRYPSDWKLKEITGSVNTMSGHAVHLTHPTDPAVRMIIAFKRADEEQRITPTGMGDGELVSRGSVSLLGQQVERIARVAQEKDMAVYYGWPRAAVASSDLVFWLALDCACSPADPTVTGLTPEVEQIADAVVESIEVKR